MPLTGPGHIKRSDARVAAVVESLAGVCTRTALGWWTYEVCHGQSVKQWHDSGARPQNGAAPRALPTGQPYTNMGSVAAMNAAEFYVHGETGQHGVIEHLFVDGEQCGEIAAPRSGTLHYVCDKLVQVWQLANKAGGHVLIARVKEVGKCQYQIVVHLEALCHGAIPGRALNGNTVDTNLAAVFAPPRIGTDGSPNAMASRIGTDGNPRWDHAGQKSGACWAHTT